jgi:multimeric flavodoxin WrbA
MKVKIIGISGSPRNGNTHILVKESLKAAETLKDVETEFIALRDFNIKGGCIPCYKCYRRPDWEKLCYGYKDDLNDILRKCLTGDGFVFGSPVYWGGLTPLFKMFIDRFQPIFALGRAFRNKPAGAVTVALGRAAGQEHAIAEIIREIMFQDMLPVGVQPIWPTEGMASPWGVCAQQGWPDSVPNVVEGSKEGVKQDKVAFACAKVLGKRVAEMAKVIKAGFTLVNQENNETEWPAGVLQEKDLEKTGDHHYEYKKES